MGMVAIKCPNCGADIELDDSREFGFCSFCGTKVMQDKIVVEHKGNVQIDNSQKIENWLVLARRSRDSEDYEKAISYYDQILQEDPNNWEAMLHSSLCSILQSSVYDLPNKLKSFSNNLLFIFNAYHKNNDDIEKEKQGMAYMTEKVYRDLNPLFFSMLMSGGKYNECSIRDVGLASALVFYSWGDLLIEFYGTDLADSCVTVVGCAISIDKALLDWSWLIKDSSIKSHIKLRKENYSNKLKEIKPGYKENQKSTSNNGCYVATAVYGSYDCPQVWTLRRFRDNTLDTTWYGRAFIRTYYAISPTLVKWFGDTDWFKHMWKGKLDRMVENLNKQGVEDTPYNDKY